ncbi:MAG: DNA repair exonuclease SbcCD nuclease subunit, partial [Alteromonadaceae bacterium]
MSKVTWLHLSDIHFQAKTEWRANSTREALIAFLVNKFEKDPSLKPDFITCTGDIAFGETGADPLAEQYKLAKSFFRDVLAICDLNKKQLFMVPGNHDINRQAVSGAFQRGLVAMAKESAKFVDGINQGYETKNKDTRDAMERLADYELFIKQYAKHLQDIEGRCFYTKKLDINGINIGIAGFNSVWSCAGE